MANYYSNYQLYQKHGVDDFDGLKKKLVSSKQLFEDENFDPHQIKLFERNSIRTNVEWLRPQEITSDPKFFVDGASRFDVKQGELGDCWFLSAVATLTLYEDAFKNVVSSDQSFSDDYCGLFRFTFWRFGKWIEVVIDDRLPTRNGRLLFMSSSSTNEFWSPLLEKAYAKANGSYAALAGGVASEAMEDFTGGVSEFHDLQSDCPPNLWEILQESFEKSSMLNAGTYPDPNVYEKRSPLGLIQGHSYSITDVKEIKMPVYGHEQKYEKLIRLRNPWGEQEWLGAWSDGSTEWYSIGKEEKAKLNLVSREDGEFWISYSDFVRFLDNVEIVHFEPDDSYGTGKLLPTIDNSKKFHHWNIQTFEGNWIRGISAGGRLNKKTYPQNPQFLLSIDTESKHAPSDQFIVIIALLQKYRRRLHQKEFLPIGFEVYRVDKSYDQSVLLDEKFFRENGALVSTDFINRREISEFLKLEDGNYVIIPSTFKQGAEGDFMLRIVTQIDCDVSEKCDETTFVGDGGKSVPDSVIPPTPPAKEDEALDLFFQFSEDKSNINFNEIQQLLKKTGQEFPLYLCKELMAQFDKDNFGKINADNFKLLWMSITKWRQHFRNIDRDKSGTISMMELRDVTRKITNLQISNKTLRSIRFRYGTSNGDLDLPNFVTCGIKLEQIMHQFSTSLNKSGSKFELDLDELIQLAAC